jgi:hypothetical protein
MRGKSCRRFARLFRSSHKVPNGLVAQRPMMRHRWHIYLPGPGEEGKDAQHHQGVPNAVMESVLPLFSRYGASAGKIFSSPRAHQSLKSGGADTDTYIFHPSGEHFHIKQFPELKIISRFFQYLEKRWVEDFINLEQFLAVVSYVFQVSFPASDSESG